jgi:hypothetical protein
LYAIPGRGYAVSANLSGSAALFADVTKDLADDYLCTDGKPVSLSAVYSDNTIEEVFDNRDPRLGQTAIDPRRENEMFGTGAGDFPRLPGMATRQSPTGYHYVKNFNKVESGIQSSQEVTDFPVLRYAGMLLTTPKLNGSISQGDLDISINALRDRWQCRI